MISKEEIAMLTNKRFSVIAHAAEFGMSFSLNLLPSFHMHKQALVLGLALFAIYTTITIAHTKRAVSPVRRHQRGRAAERNRRG